MGIVSQRVCKFTNIILEPKGFGIFFILKYRWRVDLGSGGSVPFREILRIGTDKLNNPGKCLMCPG